MRAVDADARRHVWCRSQALWRLAEPVAASLTDLRGALADGRYGLARHSARDVGQHCAVVLALTLYQARPVPAPRIRAAWALDRVAGHRLGRDCLTLVRSPREMATEDLAALAERLAGRVGDLVRDAPEDGAADWLTLAESIGTAGGMPAKA